MAFGGGDLGNSRTPVKNIIIGVLSVALVVSIAGTFLLNGKLTSTQGHLAALSSSYNASQASLAATKSNLTSAQTHTQIILEKIQDLNSTLQSQNSTIQNQNSTIASLMANITALQSEMNSSEGVFSALNNTISDLKAQAASQDTTISGLQSQDTTLSTILGLKNSTTETNNQQFNETPAGSTTIASFYVPYAGYVSVSGTTNSTGARIAVSDTGVSQQIAFNFSSGSTLIVPVLPGTVDVYLENQNTNSSISGILTVNYNN